mgnify:CR=1 FL=1
MRAHGLHDEHEHDGDDADEGNLAGALAIYFDSSRYTSEAERTVAENAARLAAIALQRARADERLSHLAHHDKLTNLPNRALLQEKLEDGVQPPPGEADVRNLVSRAEHGCFVSHSLTAAPRHRWIVNGQEVR